MDELTDRSAPRRGRPPDPTLRPRLLATARRLLAEGGLQALNADRLARAAGAGKSAVHRRWPDLLDLAADVVRTADLAKPAQGAAATVDDLAALAAGWSAPLSLPERAAASLVGAHRHHAALAEAFVGAVDAPLTELATTLLARRGPVDPALAPRVAQVLRALLVGRLVRGPVSPAHADGLARDVLEPLLGRPGG